MRDKDGIEIELLPDGTWRKKEENNGIGCIGAIIIFVIIMICNGFGDKSSKNTPTQVKDNTVQTQTSNKQYQNNNTDYYDYNNNDTQSVKSQSGTQSNSYVRTNQYQNGTRRVNEDELIKRQKQLEKDLKKQAKEKARQEAQQAKAEAKQAARDAKKQAKLEKKLKKEQIENEMQVDEE